MTQHVIIGLGSNLGERDKYLDAALAELSPHLGNMRASSRIETPALLLPGSPKEWDTPFLNMAVCGDCALAPHALLELLQLLEKQLGKKVRGTWGPREIDLDILAYGDLVMDDERLCVPHPALLGREFALVPLAEIAPDWVFPRPGAHHGKTASQLRKELFA